MKLFLAGLGLAALLFAMGLAYTDQWDRAAYFLGIAIYFKLLEMQI